MSKLDVAFMVAETAGRVNFVCQDPAVIEAAKRAGRDIRQAGASTAELGTTIIDSWKRSGERHPRGLRIV